MRKDVEEILTGKARRHDIRIGESDDGLFWLFVHRQVDWDVAAQVIELLLQAPKAGGITERRQRLGLSQSELARRVGTSRQQVSRLAKGERKLTVEWAERIAPALGCSARDLMFPEEG